MHFIFQGLRSELLLHDACSLNNASLADVDSILNQELISNTIVITGNISCGKISWPEAVPSKGTVHASYGSFDKTKSSYNENSSNNISPLKSILDNDSGMSSGENDESMRYVYKQVSDSNVANNEKCLTNNNQSAVRWNEIPSCSYANANVTEEHDVIESNFIVINIYESDSDSDSIECEVGTNAYVNTIVSDSSNCLVPVNNEIVKSESQKLVSLSLSILLAALLQAMRCFAQFLEDIVTPQRL